MQIWPQCSLLAGTLQALKIHLLVMWAPFPEEQQKPVSKPGQGQASCFLGERDLIAGLELSDLCSVKPSLGAENLVPKETSPPTAPPLPPAGSTLGEGNIVHNQKKMSFFSLIN